MPDKNLDPQTLEQKQAADDAAKKAADDAAIKQAADDAAKKAAEGAGGDETITIKKADWDKTNNDLENYRTGLLNEKTKNKSLEGDGVVAQTGTLDEKKIVEIATQAALAGTHKKNEKSAIKLFLQKHPEYVDDQTWQQLIPLYKPISGKDDEESIISDLEDAVLSHKRRTGKLDEYLAQQSEAAKQQAEMTANVNFGHNAGGVGTKTNSGSGQPSIAQSTLDMGTRFGHNKEKIENALKEMPKTPDGYVIDVTKPRIKK